MNEHFYLAPEAYQSETEHRVFSVSHPPGPAPVSAHGHRPAAQQPCSHRKRTTDDDSAAVRPAFGGACQVSTLQRMELRGRNDELP